MCGALLAAFLLWNKVHSPQYTLWLIPFFVLIRVHVLWWVGYAIADLMVYVGVFRWFYSFAAEQDFPALRIMEAGIWARAASCSCALRRLPSLERGARDGAFKGRPVQGVAVPAFASRPGRAALADPHYSVQLLPDFGMQENVRLDA